MNLTPEQKKAIETNGNNILVSAGAGSGKTFVLVERMLNKIIQQKNVNIDELLIVTFTNAAASEMKERILLRIEKELENNPENQFLQEQLIRINKAYISTIDSFCLKVVKENFKSIDIEPNFRIGEKSEIDLIKEDALETFLEKYYEEKEEWFYSLLDCFTKKADDKYFKEIFLKIYEQAQNSPYPNLWLKDAYEIYNINTKEEYFKSEIFQKILDYAKETFETCMQIKNHILNLILNDEQEKDLEEFFNKVYVYKGTKKGEKIEEVRTGEFIQISNCFNYLISKDIENFLISLENIQFQTIKRINNPVLKEEIKIARDILKDLINNLKETFFNKPLENILNENKIIYNHLKNLCNLIVDFDKYYLDIKKHKNLYTFNDISHFCLKILIDIDWENTKDISEYLKKRKPSLVAQNYANLFKEIITDEYQDSNLIQEEILDIISNGKNRFMVGDIKQCIYRFRQADTSIFNKKYIDYKNNLNGERIDLNANFRSSKNVIESINIIFENLMTTSLGEVFYDNDSKLKKITEEPNPSENINISKECELCIIEKDEEDLNNNNEKIDELKELENMEIEAHFIAKKIKHLIEDEKLHIFKDNEYKPLEYKDIVILARNKKFGATCGKIFEEYNIPIFAQNDSEFYEILEIDIILNVLKIIDNPLQDIPLISVMYSSMFDFSANELLEIKLKTNEKIYYNCLTSYINQPEINVILKNKITIFLAKIEYYKYLSKLVSINELLSYIYKDSNYYNYIGLLKNGKTRQANLTSLLEKSVAFEKNTSHNIFEFITYIEKIRNKKPDDTEASVVSENENLVRFMTIHKSKGLEFPVVFVSNLAGKFNMSDTKDLILFEPKYKLGVSLILNKEENQISKRYQINSIQKHFISEKLKQDLYSEEVRILYVALTRAKEKLILTGCTTKSKYTKKTIINSEIISNKINSPILFRKTDNYLNWVYNILNSYKHNWKIEILNKENIISNLKFNESNIENKDENNFYNLFELDKNKIFSNKFEYINNMFNWHYPYELDKNLESNLTVSEIKRKFNTEKTEDFILKNETTNFNEASYNLPKFYNQKDDISPLIKGTLYHTILEHLDININTFEKLEDFLQSLEKNGILKSEELEIIDKNKIWEFLNSNLAKRLKNATNIFKETPFKLGVSPSEIYEDKIFEKSSSVIIVNGIIDLLFEENGEIVLVDYKTDNTDNKKELLKRYSTQMKIYKKAIEKATGKNVKETIIYLILKGKEIIF